ncbi:hypothetical protein [Nocardia inohanensis]|uniref:hypothetical protein n=1 Tax=Nocardia inohanensis TaxID=209246 RepID=UPI000834931E|nr:hypothetical protein [Nocardia inohanensis]
MLTEITNEDTSRHSFWPRVREFAVPPSMIEIATARRQAGDWAGACAAAGFDVDIDLRWLARVYGRELGNRVRGDLRHLAPDLLRWHLPRIAPDGLLRPGLTIALARYAAEKIGNDCGRAGSVHLVARTAPVWADAGQRIELALWDGSGPANSLHPHPRPDRRFRLDLHRHLWDARRAGELRGRGGAREPAARWAAEARILLDAEGRQANTFLLRTGARQRTVLELVEDDGPPTVRLVGDHPAGGISALPVLPDAAIWEPPDSKLLRSGMISADRLHPLVASALAPDYTPDETARARVDSARRPLVACRGEQHRIGLVDGVLTALDHDPDEIRREELLVALTRTPMLPCLRVIDQAHRNPECLNGVRERLHHGDTAGALAIIEGLLGPGAHLRDGALRDELDACAHQRIIYGLYRAVLARPLHGGPSRPRPRSRRGHPRNATV